MSILSGLKNSIAFLTILPIGMDKDAMLQAAAYMPLFPIIGGFLGLLTGLFVWALEFSLKPEIAGILGLGFILLLTGVHHTDGLLDFGDGIMFHGSRREKLRVMRDSTTGAGGFSLGLITLVATGLAIGELPRHVIMAGLVAAESAAKYAMVLQTSAGTSAAAGMNTAFVHAMRKRGWPIRFAAPFLLLAVLVLPLPKLVGFLVIASSTAMSLAILLISKRHFGGITGDVMGATNDLTRLASLLCIIVTKGWA